MRRAEVVFVLVVAAVGAAFVVRTVAETSEAVRLLSFEGGFPAGGAGAARDVDMEKLRRGMQEGRLSEREALYYDKIRRDRETPAPRDAASSRRALRAMGTEGTLVVVATRSAAAEEALADAEREIRRIESIMSVYDEASEISRFNAAGRGPFPLSEESAFVLQYAEWMCRATGGAFDATCRPVVELWKRAARENRLPSGDEVRSAREISRWSDLEILADGAVKGRPEVCVDLGGIAKGHGIDRAAEAMAMAEVEGGMAEVGGDLRCFGPAPGGDRWRVAVRHPFRKDATCATLAIGEGAVCTSGGYERFAAIEGKQCSHIIDPRTGRPAEGAVSATVIAPRAILADAWATALVVLGAAGLDLLPKDRGVEAMVVGGSPEKPEVRMTPGFRNFLVSGPEF